MRKFFGVLAFLFISVGANASTTIISSPTASAYDGDQLTTTMNITANPCNIVDATGEWYAVLVGSITIPAGQVIESAFLSLYFPDSTLDEPSHPMYAHDTASPGILTTGASDISNRTRTTATVTWSSTNLGAAGRFNSPDIKTIIQELYDSYGPYSNGHMMIIINGSATGTRDFAVTTVDSGTTANYPYLSITYGEPSTIKRRVINAVPSE